MVLGIRLGFFQMNEWTKKYKNEIYVTEVFRIRCISCGNWEELIPTEIGWGAKLFDWIEGTKGYKCKNCMRIVEGK